VQDYARVQQAEAFSAIVLLPRNLKASAMEILLRNPPSRRQLAHGENSNTKIKND
jgi:hypothetical protein